MKKFLFNTGVFALFFIAIYVLIGKGLRQGVSFDNYYPELRWDDFHSQPDNSIDLLFLGSSHCYRSFIPQVFDTLLAVNSFNLGSSNQSPITSYFVLKEALCTQSPKKIILEVNPEILLKGNNFHNAMLIFDYMNCGYIRYEMILTADYYSNLFDAVLPEYRFRKLKSIFLNDEKSNFNVNVINEGLTSGYMNKGYVITTIDGNFSFNMPIDSLHFNPSDFSNERVSYINRIAILCEENNAQLVLVTQPINPLLYTDEQNYVVFHQMIDSLAGELDVIYFDGNKSTDLIIPPAEYYDGEHLLYSGAQIFSLWMVEKLRNVKSDENN